MAAFSSPENMWIKFFSDAGLPSGISATYALTFTQNRIQMNMLLDLNKEYLREMGITCMGDVIAILRHAKQVHEETARDRVLGITTPKVPIAAVAGRPGQQKPATPATRMLEHYTRNIPVNISPPNSISSVKERLGGMRISATKRKVVTPNVHSITKTASLGDNVASTKHSRQTLSQQNIYGIATSNMDSDTPVSSQKALMANVFSRLGSNDEILSAATSAMPQKISITNIKQSPTSSVQKTVFARLGDKGTQQDSVRRDSTDSNEPLKYEGILKSSPIPKKIIIKRIVEPEIVKIVRTGGTMRADETPINVREKLPLTHPQRKSVKFSPHIDYKEIEKRSDSSVLNKIPINNIRTVALSQIKTVIPAQNKIIKRIPINVTQTNIKMRLGKSNLIVKNVKTKSSVFGRLGVTLKN